ncbi:MAG: chromosome segregation protein SMC, partial [Ruminococcus sp.]|nr:chromosome segregation protein SMC [Ruminococcus sp.]
MYLKSLEIQGFKSFPDRISLTFDKGLTAVVGPNGSGKSNIGDSVRWVLGEQSTKTLRGNKMEDVIFSGSSARKPMGFAAVTLNIDNSDRTLSDMEDEVSVTRKLYRSGESEYLINGRQVRLKDINELFMDTGLGRDGYSIIGQGRIAEIVGAKSSERRDIFEEAAGISKFRYKKLEAERKLSSAQENILRLNDILSELEGRVEPLRIQSQKAEKFIKLAEEKKKLEISVWVSRLDEFRKKIEAVDAKILVAKNEYENTDNDINSQEQRLDESYRKMQECTVRMEQLRQKMLEEEQSASDMKSQIAVLENDIQHCEAAVNAAKVSISACDEKKKELGVLINVSEKKTSSLEAEKASSEKEAAGISELFEQAERDSSELGSHVDKTGGEINALYIRQSELRMKCASAEEQLEEEKKRLEELSQTSISFEKTMAEHNGQLEECDRKLADNEENAVQLRNRLSGFERLYGSRKESFEQTKTELEKVLYTYREKQQRRKIL